MNKLILLLTYFLTISSTSDKDTSAVSPFIGKWKSFESIYNLEEDEILTVENNNKTNEACFRRFFHNEIVSEGNFFVENGFLVVTRSDSLLKYKLKYALSTDAETLVVMKPNSSQAWLFFRIGF